VFDFGGHHRLSSCQPGGAVDYTLAQSVPLGIHSVIADFEKSFRSNNLEAVKDTQLLPREIIQFGSNMIFRV